MKQSVKKVLRSLGYEIRRVHKDNDRPKRKIEICDPPPAINPVWPLPNCGVSHQEIREQFRKYDLWHYAYQFEGGLSFPIRRNHPDLLSESPERPLQRFRHFVPYLVQANQGSLRGKRVLDIACNSGFWSLQCALLGAEVVGFDGREEMIQEANLIKSIVGVDKVEFRVLDFWEMNPERLGGTFDIVLNLGILYHLSDPIRALQLTKAMAEEYILLDTDVCPSKEPVIRINWEEDRDIRNAIGSGIVAHPSKTSLDLIFRYIGVANWFEIPLRSADMPADYLRDSRASWLIKVV